MANPRRGDCGNCCENRTAIECGYRHIDTAAVYGNEVGVGEGIKEALATMGITREYFD